MLHVFGKFSFRKKCELLNELIWCNDQQTVPYTIELIKRIAPYNVKWVEEFLPPDDYDGYEQVKKAVGGACLLTTGEHEYTRYGFRELISRKCVGKNEKLKIFYLLFSIITKRYSST